VNQRQKILSVIRRIPKGRVSTYGAVARAAGFPGAARQVVWALHRCAPDVPWHRVVGAGGKVLLKGAPALEQRLRLQSEGVPFHGERVPMDRYEFLYPRRVQK
jgi:methylated-DNA-protein-cysteine methyltransferase-like protein